MICGVVGLGDMGSGLVRNLIKNGYQTHGYNRSEEKALRLAAEGMVPAKTLGALATLCDVVFVMVMDGVQAHEVILGPNGLTAHLRAGSAIILTSTIAPKEAEAIGAAVAACGLDFIDTPVSGGYPGAQNGTLSMMAAASPEVLARHTSVLQAISAHIHHVGEQAGAGQTMKACLQSLIGAQFAATFEAAALAAKAGVSGQALLDVFSSSSAGCGIVNNALEKIIDRQFEGTGSHIDTMHKDLCISTSLGQDLNVPLHTASAALQIFHAGRAKYPDGDNWVCTRVIEEIVGAELHRNTKGASTAEK